MVRCCSVAPCCCATAPRRVACKLTNPALPAQLAFCNKKKPQATSPRMPGVNISSFFVKKQKAAHGLQLIGARSNLTPLLDFKSYLTPKKRSIRT